MKSKLTLLFLLICSSIYPQWSSIKTTNSGLLSDYVKDIYEDSKGNIWFATSNGLNVFNGTEWSNYTTSNSKLISNNISCIFEDKNSNMWFGHSGVFEGVSKFDGVNWTNYNSTNSTIYSDVLAINQDKDGVLWFGGENNFFTANKALSKFDGKNWSNAGNNNINNCGLIYSIYKDSNDYIWFCTNYGLVRYDGINWVTYNESNGLYYAGATIINQDSKGIYWIGAIHSMGRSGYLQMFDGVKTWNTFQPSVFSLQYGEKINDIITSQSDEIFVGMDIYSNNAGLRIFDGKNWKVFNDNGNIQSPVNSIIHDKKGNTWFATFGNGVYVKKNIITANLKLTQEINVPSTITQNTTHDISAKITNAGEKTFNNNLQLKIKKSDSSDWILLKNFKAEIAGKSTNDVVFSDVLINQTPGDYNISLFYENDEGVFQLLEGSSLEYSVKKVTIIENVEPEFDLTIIEEIDLPANVIINSTHSINIKINNSGNGIFHNNLHVKIKPSGFLNWSLIKTVSAEILANSTQTITINDVSFNQSIGDYEISVFYEIENGDLLRLGANPIEFMTKKITIIETPNQTIKGTVYDVTPNTSNHSIDNSSLSGCKITLHNMNTDVLIAETISDSNGEFIFNDLTENSYIIKATIEKSNEQMYFVGTVIPVKCVVSRQVNTGDIITVKNPISLHLHIQRYIEKMRNLKTHEGKIFEKVKVHDISNIEEAVNNWKNIETNDAAVIDEMWQLLLALRVQDRINSEIPLMVNQMVSYSGDLLKGIVSIFPILSDIDDKGFGGLVDENGDYLVAYKMVLANEEFTKTIDNDIENLLNKLTKPLPKELKIKEGFLELLQDIKLEFNSETKKDEFKLDVADVMKSFITIFENYIIKGGNRYFVQHYIDYTQEPVSKLINLDLGLTYYDELIKTENLLSIMNHKNSDAIHQSEKLMLWADYTDLFEEYIGYLGDALIVTGIGGGAGAACKTISKILKIANPALIGAAIAPPANRYSEMLCLPFTWHNDNFKSKLYQPVLGTFDIQSLRSKIKLSKSYAMDYNESLTKTITDIQSKKSNEIIYDNFINLLQLGNKFDTSVEQALKPLDAAILFDNGASGLDSLYYRYLPNTISSNSQRMAFNLELYGYLLNPKNEYLDDLALSADSLKQLNNGIENELNLVYNKVENIEVPAYIALTSIEIPRYMLFNSSRNATVKFENIGKVTAINLHAKIINKNTNMLIDSIYFGDLQPNVEETLTFNFNSSQNDTLETVEVKFYSDNALSEVITRTIQNSTFYIVADITTQTDTSLVLNSKLDGNYKYQWLRNGSEIPNAIISKYKARSNGTYSLKISDGNYSQISNEIVISGLSANGINSTSISKDFKIYPSPAKFFTKISSIVNIERIEICEISGRIIQNYLVNSKTYILDVNKLTKGVYLIKGFTEDGVKIGRFVKE